VAGVERERRERGEVGQRGLCGEAEGGEGREAGERARLARLRRPRAAVRVAVGDRRAPRLLQAAVRAVRADARRRRREPNGRL